MCVYCIERKLANRLKGFVEVYTLEGIVIIEGSRWESYEGIHTVPILIAKQTCEQMISHEYYASKSKVRVFPL